uniref:hypothetical protein n=1 Tax=Hafnia paralvei TaxID=546367 RepID=UPI0026DB8F05|nr:hypothetical protein [Hafnia paralvei]
MAIKDPVRIEAIKRGEKKYQGNPCMYGHTERRVSNGSCIECGKAKRKEGRRKESYKKISTNENDYNHKVMIIGSTDINISK